MNKFICFIYNNREIITILISFLALAISIITLISNYKMNKKNLKMVINNFTSAMIENGNFYIFNIDFINKSRLPISINEISIDNEFTFIKSPRKLIEGQTTKNKTITSEYDLKSTSFPINMLGLESKNVFLVVYGPTNLNVNKYKFHIKTNRGEVVQKIKLCNYNIDGNTFFEEANNYCKRFR
ncbi:MAG: hypothetical protein J5982_00325 [Bacilli bacterium]|nr:hypothetical protein [Bacilli bacterium]